MAFDGRLLSGVGVLAAVIEAGSFVRAAEALGLSASGVSRAVARLEARVGARLVERTTRSLALTDEGRRFYEEVAPLLAGIEEAAIQAAGAAGAVRGRLRVSLDPYVSRNFLAPRMAGLLARHPELTLDLVTRETVGDLAADGFDLAVRFGEPAAAGLIARKLTETRILTVAAPAYLARRGRPAHPGELEHHDCIQFRDPQTGRPFEWVFLRSGEALAVRSHGRLMVSDVGALIGACVGGAGVAQVMALSAQAELARGDLVELFPDWPDERFPLYALYPSRRHPPAKVRAFVEVCLETLRPG
ncbi:MAG: LysR family transcriptional regulator [Caulobacteraceae bacterium]|nr:LysR family transcriptional regulator [Caulobacteraceae bacterium]